MRTKDSATALTADESAVELLYKQLINSWNKYDSDGYAALFTDNGSIVGFDGSQVNGQREIHSHLLSIFADHKPAKYVTIIHEIRLISPDVYLLRAVAGMIPPGQKEINPKTNAVQSLVAIRENHNFRVALFQNTPASFHGRPQLAQQLTKELQQQYDKMVN